MTDKNLDEMIELDPDTSLEPRILNEIFNILHPDLRSSTFYIRSSEVGAGLVRDINISYELYSGGCFIGNFKFYSTIWYGEKQKILELNGPERIDS